MEDGEAQQRFDENSFEFSSLEDLLAFLKTRVGGIDSPATVDQWPADETLCAWGKDGSMAIILHSDKVDGHIVAAFTPIEALYFMRQIFRHLQAHANDLLEQNQPPEGFSMS